MIGKLRLIFPNAKTEWLAALADELSKSSIDTANEMASFFAQLNVESRGMTVFEESLYYSTPERLCTVWPHRFSMTSEPGKISPIPFVKNPQALANYVYSDANRGTKFALGNTLPGDGWKYRGMGPPQITGKNNYRRCSEALGLDLISNPELLKVPIPGVKSAIWFWKDHGLDAHDDDLDVRAETRILNGGETALAERQAFMNKCVTVLQ